MARVKETASIAAAPKTATRVPMGLVERLKHARRVGVPLVAINTTDQWALMARLAEGLNGGTAILAWNYVRGASGVNEAGAKIAKGIEAKFLEESGGLKNSAGEPASFLAAIADSKLFPEDSICCVQNVELFVQDGSHQMQHGVRQALSNLRDEFKSSRRMAIMLQTDIRLPAMLKDDVLILDDPLPTAGELRDMICRLDSDASRCPKCAGTGRHVGVSCESCKGSGKGKREKASEKRIDRATEAVMGLSAFAAEQAAAMSVRVTPAFDLDHLWETKRAMVAQTRGLSVYKGGEKFADLGGLRNVKQYLSRLMTGRRPPRVVVWLDEIEKSGLGHTGDTSGVNADQLGTMLSYMEDHSVYGVLLLGVPGAGKSAIAKACGAEFDRLVIRMDLGEMQEQWVGASQNNIRSALRVVSAIGADQALWIATSNSVEGLDSALRSRFTDTFFFDLPDEEERSAIWKVWLAKYPELGQPNGVDREGLVGRNIKKIVEKAWSMNLDLAEASKTETPVSEMEKETVARLRAMATGRYLSATEEGVYQSPVSEEVLETMLTRFNRTARLVSAE